ncbi:hypothetical protein P4637_11845 [Halalkalibacterium halodurans]|uniref:hypothetical protein n=1 Tax=Halalkalibacterium halodurans TaxID=86665 RepID=UPI002E1B7F48|nr:hypothetical protein [Halalkalibacterium halodurans]MED4085505.1 hypothetical protein [Halalkalibacterium halodurans]MED4106735.1 hypothetical protein [Halalkalibacterium halodurans]MED4110056.1 hypothetical protein [Halalkalibacterium halodurans]MED4125506.1 hypothetical protein [Halalkalibacterium halodurans]
MIRSYFLKPQYDVGLSVADSTFDQYFFPTNHIEEARKWLPLGQPIFLGTFRMFIEDEPLFDRVYIDSIDSFWFGMLSALEALQTETEASFPFTYQPFDFQLNRNEQTLTLLLSHDSSELERCAVPLSTMNMLLTGAEEFFQDCHAIGLTVIDAEYQEITQRIERLKK